MKLALHFLAEGNSCTLTEQGVGEFGLCVVFLCCSGSFPCPGSQVQAGRHSVYWTLLQRCWIPSQHWRSDSCHHATTFSHLFFFFSNGVTDLLCQAEKAQRNICRDAEGGRDAEGVNHAEFGGWRQRPLCERLRLKEVGGFLVGHRTQVGRCRWVKWRLLQNKISEGKISWVAGNSTEFYGLAQSFDFHPMPSYYFLAAMLLLPFSFYLHSLLLSSIFHPLCAYTS